jgi:hypothetical protein
MTWMMTVVSSAGIALAWAAATAWRFRRIFHPTVSAVSFDNTAATILDTAARQSSLRIIACEPIAGTDHRTESIVDRVDLPESTEGIFLEVGRPGPATKTGALHVIGLHQHGYQILRVNSAAVAQAIAAVSLQIRDRTGRVPRIDFLWPESPHAWQLLRFLCFGTGETAAVTREILHRAEPDAARRPIVHIG